MIQAPSAVHLHAAAPVVLEAINWYVIALIQARRNAPSDAVRLHTGLPDGYVAQQSNHVSAFHIDISLRIPSLNPYAPQIEKYRKDAASAASAATAHESRAKEVSKDVGRVEKERKAAEAEAKARDVRLARALEEVERYKAALEAARAQVRRDTATRVRHFRCCCGARAMPASVLGRQRHLFLLLGLCNMRSYSNYQAHGLPCCLNRYGQRMQR